MASHLQPIKLFSFAAGLNPWKVAIFLEELGLPHETQFMEPPQMKEPEYKKINPNGLYAFPFPSRRWRRALM